MMDKVVMTLIIIRSHAPLQGWLDLDDKLEGLLGTLLIVGGLLVRPRCILQGVIPTVKTR